MLPTQITLSPRVPPTKRGGKKIERNEETIGDILAAEASLGAPGVRNIASDSRSGKSHEINFPVTSNLP